MVFSETEFSYQKPNGFFENPKKPIMIMELIMIMIMELIMEMKMKLKLIMILFFGERKRRRKGKAPPVPYLRQAPPCPVLRTVSDGKRNFKQFGFWGLGESDNLTAMHIIHCVANKRLALWESSRRSRVEELA